MLIFNDTFTNYYNPEIGVAAMDVLQAGGLRVGVAANVCCGRPLISKGLLSRARERARENVSDPVTRMREAGKKFVFCEPSCLSAVREDAPSLLRGEEQRKAEIVAKACVLFEEFVESELAGGRIHLEFTRMLRPILLHGHCHQKSMGLLPVAKTLLARIPGAKIIDPDAGCCGMAGRSATAGITSKCPGRSASGGCSPQSGTADPGTSDRRVRILVPASDPGFHRGHGHSSRVTPEIPAGERLR